MLCYSQKEQNHFPLSTVSLVASVGPLRRKKKKKTLCKSDGSFGSSDFGARSERKDPLYKPLISLKSYLNAQLNNNYCFLVFIVIIIHMLWVFFLCFKNSFLCFGGLAEGLGGGHKVFAVKWPVTGCAGGATCWTVREWYPLRFGYVSSPLDFDSILSASQFLVKGGVESHATRSLTWRVLIGLSCKESRKISLSPHLWVLTGQFWWIIL